MKIAIKKYRKMKSKVILIQILFMLVIMVANAQSPIHPLSIERGSIPDGAYIKDTNNDLDKFVGTWKYTQGNDEFTIVIQKVIQQFNGDYYEDEVVGRFKYVQNGVVVADYLNSLDAQISGNIISSDKKELFLHIDDPEKPRASYRLNLKFLDTDIMSGDTQVKWELRQTGYYTGYIPGETPPTDVELDQTKRIPTDLILDKQ